MTTAQSPVAAGTPAQRLFSDLASELETTRRVLARVPEDRFDWAPHTKSMTLGRLASHLAELPRLGTLVLTLPEYDMVASGFKPATASNSAELLAMFDETSAAMRDAVERLTWEQVDERWTLRAGAHVIMEDAKGPLLRTLGISHIIHHRAQLGVYLRLLDVAVPRVYGPSADEQ